MAEGVHTAKNKKQGAIDRSKTLERAKAKADTDSGLTAKQKQVVNRLEASIRDNDNEDAYIIGRNGEQLAKTVRGNSHQAYFDQAELRRSAGGVLVHNHPGAWATGASPIAKGIGAGFSKEDLALGISNGLTEIRAVTRGNYTYSMRFNGNRPNWRRVYDEMQEAKVRHMDSFYDYIYRQVPMDSPEGRQRFERAAIIATHRANKEIAKRYGFTYTRRKSR